MKISGFSFVRNGSKLYYPITEAIRSILPICDEYIVAVGKGDEDDTTRDDILAINDPKIKIIDTEWDEQYWKRGAINAVQTDIAKSHCTGDWCFYLQADEIVHEKYLQTIRDRCEELLDRKEVEGLLFGYVHFWGDYYHYHKSHGWYPYEIRIVRNLPQIHSWQSAQSFRWYDYYESTHQEKGTRKIRVAKVDAKIYHYGWVRPPRFMQNKRKALDSVHLGRQKAEQEYALQKSEFDYGPLDRLAEFKDTHPKVMHERIKAMDWKDKLQYSGKPDKSRQPHKHEKFKYRFMSWLENNFNSGKQIWGFKNYEMLKDV